MFCPAVALPVVARGDAVQEGGEDVALVDLGKVGDDRRHCCRRGLPAAVQQEDVNELSHRGQTRGSQRRDLGCHMGAPDVVASETNNPGFIFVRTIFVQNGNCSPFLELTPTPRQMPRDVMNIFED